MIRRDDGEDWLLVSQVDHARIAAEIAEAWGNAAVPRLPLPDQLVPAVRDHDAGWIGWERAPRIDPVTGKPRNFLEMPMQDATAIWSRSIETCAVRGPLGGIWPSQHFCHLGEHARESRHKSAEEITAVDHFLAAQHDAQERWRVAASADGVSPEILDARIEFGYRAVQFFDGLSLWLCCAPETAPKEFTAPGLGALVCIPRTPSAITLAPYPLNVAALELRVPAKRIRMRVFSSDAELQRALHEAPSEVLQWELSAN